MTALPILMPKYSYQDYKNWKDDWELIDGYPWSLMPSPIIRHANVQGNAYFQGKLFLRDHQKCNCAILNEVDWKVNADTVVRPDVMMICGEAKSDYLEFPPILIIEVLSPSTRIKDRNVKFQLYQEQGVKYYLMADYDRKTVEVFELIDNVYRSVQKNTFILENNCEITFEFDKFWD